MLEKIAIIGIAGEFPGSPDVRTFWKNLCDGRNGVHYFSDGELRDQGVSDDVMNHPNYVKASPMIDGYDQFDAGFFHFSPKESEAMDPQHRRFLQCAWAAFEDAGYVPSHPDLPPVGVFASAGGIVSSYILDYVEVNNDIRGMTADMAHIANDKDFLATRVSYKLNLTGPSMTVQTACSSSLASIHLACQSMRQGECGMALVGASNIRVPQCEGYMATPGHIYSASGHCRAFDADADGILFGSGVAAVLLKPLDDARRDNDSIYAVISGTAINNDGGDKLSYTASGSKGQYECMSQAIESAGVSVDDIGYIEAHGTGTAMGDPVEVNAMIRAFTQATHKSYCAIGSVKSNIGHLESASGITGLIKTALILKHQIVPPTINYTTPNPKIPFDKSPFYVAESLKTYSKESPLRYAGVNSLGVGGTNVFAVLEAPPESPAIKKKIDAPAYIVSFSAKSAASLKDMELAFARFLSDTEVSEYNMTLGDISYMRNVRRSHFKYRSAFVFRDLKALAQAMNDVVDGMQPDGYYPLSEPENMSRPLFQSAYEDAMSKLTVASDTSFSDKDMYFKQLSILADLYVRGMMIDWPQLYDHDAHRRSSLPTYPFKKTRYWVTPKISMPEFSGMSARLSEFQMSEVTVAKSIRLQDQILSGHVVGDRSLLPGVAYLEFAYQTALSMGDQSAIPTFTHGVWTSPLFLDNDREDVLIHALTKNGDIHYTIRSTHTDQTHSQGRLVFNMPMPEPLLEPSVSFDSVKQRCPHSVEQDVFYSCFEKKQMHYGPAFRAVQRAFYNDNEIIGELRRPELSSAFPGYNIHPGMLDSVFQLMALVEIQTQRLASDTMCEAMSNSLYVPVAIDELTVLSSFPEHCWVYAKTAMQDGSIVCDINVFSDDNRMILSIKRYVARPSAPAASSSSTLSAYSRVFTPMPIAEGVDISKGNVLIVGSDNAFDTAFRSRFSVDSDWLTTLFDGDAYTKIDDQHYALNHSNMTELTTFLNHLKAIDRWPETIIYCCPSMSNDDDGTAIDHMLRHIVLFIQHILTIGPSGNLRIMLMASLPQDQKYQPFYRALESMTTIVPLERSDTVVQFIECHGSMLDILINEFTAPPTHTVIRYASGTRLCAQCESIDLVQSAPTMMARRGGTYLISGGAGGISRYFVDMLTQQGAAHIILIGRRKTSIADIDAQAHVHYHQCDVTDRHQVQELMSVIRATYGPLHGVVHAAGITNDCFWRNKDVEEFFSVIHVKTKGTQHLDIATRDEPLDFFLMCSSVTSVLGNIGQVDYAYGNAFIDHYAAYRSDCQKAGKRNGKTLSINWPLWENGGMQVGDESRQWLSAQFGMVPLPDNCANDILRKCLSVDVSQLIILYGNAHRFESLLFKNDHQISDRDVDDDHTQSSDMPISINETDIQQAILRVVSSVSNIPIEEIDLTAHMSDYGFDSMMLIDLANRLNETYDLSLSPATFFEYGDLEAFCDYMFESFSSHFIPAVSKTDTVAAPVESESLPSRSEDISGDTECSVGHDDDIVVIGMSGIFPGAANVDEFWENMKEGVDAVSEIPEDRWNWRDYDGDPETQYNKTRCKWGGFIDGVAMFDAPFFGYSPTEAALSDPQQRLLLRTVYSLIEEAGYSLESMSGSDTGVFIGASTMDYYELIAQSNLNGEAYFATGTLHSLLANRLSFYFNWHGPSQVIDTACSSSLIAIHRAVKSIRSGQCGMAVAGGVNAILSPRLFLSFSKAGMLSSDGRCKTFDASANGYVRGEGVGGILLKKRSKAIEDGDHIYGVIRGSSENHGGKAHSLTAPNPNAQSDLLCDVYKNAGIDPRSISYIEAHGTGTSLGDPIEVNALKNAFNTLLNQSSDGHVDPHNAPWCYLGSVKTNIGHLEAAAGIAGVIKVLKSMQHQTVPKHLHFHSLNPYIDLSQSPFKINNETTSWTPHTKIKGVSQPYRAGVSSFGFGGSNSHIILESMNDADALSVGHDNDIRRPYLIPLSARSESALCRRVNDLRDWLENDDNASLISTNDRFGDLSFTLCFGRDHFDSRVIFIADSADRLIQILDEWIHDDVSKTAPIVAPDIDLDRHADVMQCATHYVNGDTVDMNRLFEDKGRFQRLSLPTYPFELTSYWYTDIMTHEHERNVRQWGPQRLHSPMFNDRLVFDNTWHIDAFPFLRDHRFKGHYIVSASSICSSIFSCAQNISESQTPRCSIRDVTFHRPLIMTESNGHHVQMFFDSEDSATIYSLQVMTAPDDSSMPNAWEMPFTGVLHLGEADCSDTSLLHRLHQSVPELPTSMDGAAFYRDIVSDSLHLGSSFQWISSIDYSDTYVRADLRSPSTIRSLTTFSMNYHPGFLDSVLQVLTALIPLDERNAGSYLLSGWKQLECYAACPEAAVVVARRSDSSTNTSLLADVTVIDSEENVVLEFSEVRLMAVANDFLDSESPRMDRWNYTIDWVESPQREGESSSMDGSWLVFGNDDSVTEVLSQRIRDQGGAPEVITDVISQDTWDLWPSDRHQDRTALRGIIYLWGLRSDHSWDVTSDQLLADQERCCRGLLRVVQQCASYQVPMWIVTSGAVSHSIDTIMHPTQGLLWGMGRTIGMEYLDRDYILIDIDTLTQNALKASLDLMIEDMADPTEERQLMYRQHRRFVARLHAHTNASIRHDSPPPDIYQWEVSSNGSNDLTRAARVLPELKDNDIHVKVRYSSVSYRDWMSANGMLKGPSVPLGDEGVGDVVAIGSNVTHVRNGDHVMFFSPGSLCSDHIIPAHCCVPIPKGMSLEESATIPVSFLVAFYCLQHRYKIKKGQHILIHSAGGGVGLAAVQLAVSAGATVHALVSRPEKRFLLSSLGVKHIYYSRDTAFYDQIKSVVPNGIDVVINTHIDHVAVKSAELLHAAGYFMDLTKQVTPVSDHHISVDLYDVAETTPEDIQSMLMSIKTSFEQKKWNALPRRVYDSSDMSEVMSVLGGGRHTGKCIMSVEPRNRHIRSGVCYLIIGAWGALSFEVVHWLVEQGADTFCLVDRLPCPEAKEAELAQFRSKGCEISTRVVDVSDPSSVATLMADLREASRPLKGLFHCAAAIDDDPISSLSWDRFPSLLSGKVIGSWLLHLESISMDLDHFVLFSSVAGVMGSPNQSNYAAGNAYQDSLAHYRRTLGLPALAINWAPWTVGIGAEMGERAAAVWDKWGTGVLNIHDDVPIMATLLPSDATQIAVIPMDWARYSRQFISPPAFIRDIISDDGSENTVIHDTAFVSELRSLGSVDEQIASLTKDLRQTISDIVGVDVSVISDDTAFTDMGLDSLKLIELNDVIQRRIGIDIPVVSYYSYSLIPQFVSYLKDILNLHPSSDDDVDGDDPTSVSAPDNDEDYSTLSEAELEAMLLNEVDTTL